MKERPRDWVPHGYREAGLGTATPDFWLDCFVKRGGWSLLWEGPGSEQPLWPASAPCPRREWLLGQADWPTGQVRLFEFDATVPAPRDGARTWDTGGIFDLDVRVKDLPTWSKRLTSDGFTGMSEPIIWPFGDLRIGEWLAKGPDGVVLAPAIAVDDDGAVTYVYVDTGQYAAFLTRRGSGGWAEPANLGTTYTDSGDRSATDVAFDADGYLHVAFLNGSRIVYHTDR